VGILLSLYFLFGVYVYLSIQEKIKVESQKIYLPLVVVFLTCLSAPIIVGISFLDFSNGKLTREVVGLSFRLTSVLFLSFLTEKAER